MIVVSKNIPSNIKAVIINFEAMFINLFSVKYLIFDIPIYIPDIIEDEASSVIIKFKK